MNIKSCPFCGCIPSLMQRPLNSDSFRAIKIEDTEIDGKEDSFIECECFITGGLHETPRKAIEIWNTRV